MVVYLAAVQLCLGVNRQLSTTFEDLLPVAHQWNCEELQPLLVDFSKYLQQSAFNSCMDSVLHCVTG